MIVVVAVAVMLVRSVDSVAGGDDVTVIGWKHAFAAVSGIGIP
jgi:hypothetical protein